MINLVFDEFLNISREPTTFAKSYTITSKKELYNVCEKLKDKVPKNPLFKEKVVSILIFGEVGKKNCKDPWPYYDICIILAGADSLTQEQIDAFSKLCDDNTGDLLPMKKGMSTVVSLPHLFTFKIQ